MTPPAPSILVVDDDGDTCQNLRDILVDLGYRVDIAHDGLSALEKLKRAHFDVALLDLRMPGMDGLTLSREIRKLRAGTVSLIVTAFASSQVRDEARSAGAWQIVNKPIDLPALLGLVASALDQPLVMIVDDDHELCANLWDLLRDKGYRVALAHDVAEASARLQEQSFRMVLIDVKLPAGNGADVLRAVRQANPGARALMITGFRELDPLVQQAIKEGADSVCYKPFDLPQLLAALEKLTRA
ncbi:MAG: response regulator [Gemmataceae bacterium]